MLIIITRNRNACINSSKIRCSYKELPVGKQKKKEKEGSRSYK